MKYEKYYKARDIITDIISKDLLGPVEKNEIFCGESPLDYYIVGKLYPKDMEYSEINNTSTEDCGELDSEDPISMCNGKFPSSFGISFCMRKDSHKFVLSVYAAKYSIMSDAEKVEIYAGSETL